MCDTHTGDDCRIPEDGRWVREVVARHRQPVAGKKEPVDGEDVLGRRRRYLRPDVTRDPSL